ncbi:SDR family NAD(P)-dependent oxidoreductase [Colwellia hornerae]|uniref:SDR family NAD(P)-dependent oxidoreductase n=1 Tax=Colwellia hornerae TaxID=89402 RepID=A0A5C6Q7L9_9GAMM|nr:SDR family NAD(P)-dependent oxidoreductase [Colwellia hornerae]TWX49260.1 SDR family NAD(P)-dependent oxidoreductase [Colwellia hornerae]TWX55852.1 SDR family NAD(P)-dependent oxidoreductase [Colwellia hornerae]TWX64722.1 SDR family NAD(P)-dependent oxidoreductase [Colwellia hornerae]
MNNYFQGKTIVITGASAGVGAETARALAKMKANLVLLARGQQALNEIDKELSVETSVLTIAMDVANSADCQKMLVSAQEKFGGIHYLINNAGYHQRGNVEHNTAEQLAKMVDVNLRAPIELSTLILPYIRRSIANGGFGGIVNVGSLAGRTPLQGAATYCATKSGLRAFTYALADELKGSGIIVGLVSPGPINTGFIMSEIDEVEDIVFSQPMSSPQQVTDAIICVAKGEQVEITLPRSSGWLTTVSYLFPSLRRFLRPTLYKKGRKAKKRYKNKTQ